MKLTIGNQTYNVPHLSSGKHGSGSGELCAMEMVAFLAGESHSDRPRCTCPVIAAFTRGVNDRMNDETRNRILIPLLWDLIGTKSTPDVEQRRAFKFADWAIRVAAPIVLLNTEVLRAIYDERSAARAAAGAAAWAADAADAADADADDVWDLIPNLLHEVIAIGNHERVPAETLSERAKLLETVG